jgi:hypothetical protein
MPLQQSESYEQLSCGSVHIGAAPARVTVADVVDVVPTPTACGAAQAPSAHAQRTAEIRGRIMDASSGR